jgi:hypothetical protein
MPRFGQLARSTMSPAATKSFMVRLHESALNAIRTPSGTPRIDSFFKSRTIVSTPASACVEVDASTRSTRAPIEAHISSIDLATSSLYAWS